jgi:hypothetical protein
VFRVLLLSSSSLLWGTTTTCSWHPASSIFYLIRKFSGAIILPCIKRPYFEAFIHYPVPKSHTKNLFNFHDNETTDDRHTFIYCFNPPSFELVNAERAFARLADDARIHRPGIVPVVGKETLASWSAQQTMKLNGEPIKADVSRSGDLGYSYGGYELGGAKMEDKKLYSWFLGPKAEQALK